VNQIICIGDRFAGKTHLCLEILNPDGHYIKVVEPDYKFVKSFILDDRGITIAGAMGCIHINFKADLPTGLQTIDLDIIDTLGEIWRKSWQDGNDKRWQETLNKIQTADAVLVILEPYREIINPEKDNLDHFITRQQWIKKFEKWVDFLLKECSQVSHLLICLNKVDLCLINLREEAKKLAYAPHYQPLNWQEKDNYVYHRYFTPVQSQIQRLNQHRENAARFFVTSIYQRDLLELPLIYISSYVLAASIAFPDELPLS
jgi:hypothetical protein